MFWVDSSITRHRRLVVGDRVWLRLSLLLPPSLSDLTPISPSSSLSSPAPSSFIAGIASPPTSPSSRVLILSPALPSSPTGLMSLTLSLISWSPPLPPPLPLRSSTAGSASPAPVLLVSRAVLCFYM
jgi:hypothetical protein